MAVAVLKGLASQGGAASLSQLGLALGEPPAKVHRYLASLIGEGLVLQDPATLRYALGPGAIEIGLAAMRQSDALTLCGAELAKLAEDHDISGFVSVLGNRGPTIISWKEAMHTVTVNVKVGSVLPVLWSATGLAFAAFSRSAAIDALVEQELGSRDIPPSVGISSREDVARVAARVRKLGCSPVQDLLLNGISAVAVPVFDADQGVPAVLTTLGHSASFDADPQGEPARLLKQAAAAVTLRLGGKVLAAES